MYHSTSIAPAIAPGVFETVKKVGTRLRTHQNEKDGVVICRYSVFEANGRYFGFAENAAGLHSAREFGTEDAAVYHRVEAMHAAD